MDAPMRCVELNRYVDGMLEVSRFRDYCPNGLQVEGRVEKNAARIALFNTHELDLFAWQLRLDARAVPGNGAEFGMWFGNGHFLM